MPELRRVEYPGADGTAIPSYLCLPERNEPRPCVLVLRGVAGGDEGYMRIAERFASWGYVALVHGWNRRGSDPADDVVIADLEVAFRFLASVPKARAERVAVAGFCKGGIYAFMAASRFSPLKAVVIFHGFAYRSLDDTHKIQPFDMAKAIAAPLLLLHGTEDKSASIEDMRALHAEFSRLKKPCTLREYARAAHGFAVSTHPNFSEHHAEEAFGEAERFLSEHFPWSEQ